MTSIASNRQHVADRIATGDLPAEAREDEIIRLYECQLTAKQREITELWKKFGDLQYRMAVAVDVLTGAKDV